MAPANKTPSNQPKQHQSLHNTPAQTTEMMRMDGSIASFLFKMEGI